MTFSDFLDEENTPVLAAIESCKFLLSEDSFTALMKQAKGDRIDLMITGVTSSGKSTLINSLLEQPLLPTGTRPTTSKVLRLSHSENSKLTCHLKNGEKNLIHFEDLTKLFDQIPLEEVEYFEGTYPFNRNIPVRIRLIDTPGANSTVRDHKNAAYKAFDLANSILFVSNYIQFPTHTEFTELKELYDRIPFVIWVVNKTDLSGKTDPIKKNIEIQDYQRKILEHCKDFGIKLQLPPVFVSAVSYIQGCREGNDALKKGSNLKELYTNTFGILIKNSKNLSAYSTLNHLIRYISPYIEKQCQENIKKMDDLRLETQQIQNIQQKYLVEDGILQRKVTNLLNNDHFSSKHLNKRKFDHFLAQTRQNIVTSGSAYAKQYAESLGMFDWINETRAKRFYNQYLIPILKRELEKLKKNIADTCELTVSQLKKDFVDALKPDLEDLQKKLDQCSDIELVYMNMDIVSKNFLDQISKPEDMTELGSGLSSIIGGLVLGRLAAFAIPGVGWAIGVFGIIYGLYDMFGSKEEKLIKITDKVAEEIFSSLEEQIKQNLETTQVEIDEYLKKFANTIFLSLQKFLDSQIKLRQRMLEVITRQEEVFQKRNNDLSKRITTLEDYKQELIQRGNT